MTLSFHGLTLDMWRQTAVSKFVQEWTPTVQVGEPGLGKELFIKNTFAAYCEDNDLPVNSCPPETTADAFTRSSIDFCTDIVLEVDSGQSKIHYIIQV